MKGFKNTATLLVATVLIVACFAGCGGKKTDEQLIVGTWKATVDYAEISGEDIDEEPSDYEFKGNNKLILDLDGVEIELKRK